MFVLFCLLAVGRACMTFHANLCPGGTTCMCTMGAGCSDTTAAAPQNTSSVWVMNSEGSWVSSCESQGGQCYNVIHDQCSGPDSCLNHGATCGGPPPPSCPADCGKCVAGNGGVACAAKCTDCPADCVPCIKSGKGTDCLQHCTDVATIVKQALATVPTNTWTILLQNRWGNLTYFAKDENHPRIPASNTKIWTTSCAYDQIGANVKWAWDKDRTIEQACTDILKPSWNEGADALLGFIGTRLANTTNTQKAADYVLHWASHHVGLNMTGAAMGDGCGLDRDNHFSATQITGMLRWMKDKGYKGWEKALPIGCVDGTLASRFCSEDGKGLVHAKTGTLHDVHAVSGYVNNRHDGQVYFFSIVTNNAPTDAAAASVAAIDAIAITMGRPNLPNPL